MAQDDAVESAVNEWISRNKLRDSSPRGSFDEYGDWRPSPDERRACCAAVKVERGSKRSSLLEHCRGVRHIAARYTIPDKTLRRAIEVADTGGNFYTLAVEIQGRLLSAFDPEIEYRLGELNSGPRPQKGKPGGFIVFKSQTDAMFAVRPKIREFEGVQVKIISVWADGAYCSYKKHLTYARIIPLEVLQVTQADVVAALRERSK